MIDRFVQSRYFYFFIFILYLVGLWRMSIPLTGDQKTYLSTALEMRERGEWIIPYLGGKPSFIKPPFQYWTVLLSWNVFGFNLFAALLPSVLALLGSALLVNQISEKIRGSSSRLPGFFFAATLGTMTYGTTAQMEIWIVLFYLWSWKAFLASQWTRALILVGVMAWIKGPLYPAIWVVSALIWFKLEGQLKDFFSKKFLLNLFLGIAVGLFWYVLAARTQFQAMMDGFFLQENVSKLKTTQGTPWGLWGVFFYSIFPWVFWWFYSLTRVENRRSILEHRNFYIAFGLFPALFFTFFPYRVNTYLYLLTPVAAWMLSLEIQAKKSWVMGALGLLFSVTASWIAFRLSLGGWIGMGLSFAVCGIFLMWSFGLYSLRPSLILFSSLLMVNLLRIGAVQIGDRDFEGLRQYQESRGSHSALAYWIESEDIWHEYGLFSAGLGTDIQRIKKKDELEAFLKTGASAIFSEVPNELHLTLQCEKWERLKKRMKFPLKTLILEGLSRSDPSVIRTFLICRS